MFKVGDLVELSEVGRREYEDMANNPHGQVGVITKVRQEGFPYIVEWEEAGNGYQTEDLVHAEVSSDLNLEELLIAANDLQRKAMRAVEIYNAALTAQQKALGSHLPKVGIG